MAKKNKKPQELHLEFVTKIKFTSGLCGLDELSFKDNKTKVLLYRIWSVVFIMINFINFVLLVIRVFTDIDDVVIVSTSLSYSLLYVINYISLLSLQSKQMQSFYRDIRLREAEHIKHSNSDINKIYESYAKLNNYKCRELFYVALNFATVYTIYRSEFLLGGRGYLYFQWFPFDQKKFYWVVLTDQFIFVLSVLYFNLYTKISMTSIVTYIGAKIKTLHYLIENIDHFADHYEKKLGVSLEKARHLVIAKIVKEHNETIEFVNGVKATSKTFILFDFALNSFQLGTIFIGIFGKLQTSLGEQLVLSYYCVINIQWIFTNYYHANEILILSEDVASIIYMKTQWYNFDTISKKMLMLIMNRSQTPLHLSIGPFGALGLNAFLTVMKGTFTYMTFMQSMYLE